MIAVFKGTTEACVAHLYAAIQEDYLAKRHILATFTGVDDQTVRNWFKGNRQPVGESLIKLRVYLDFLGYRVKEFEQRDEVVQNVMCVYAFGLVPLSEVADVAGYAKGRNGIDAVLRTFRGLNGISKKKFDQFASLVDLYGEQLAEKRRVTEKITLPTSSIPEKTPESKKPIPLPVRLAPQQLLGTHEALIESLAGLVTAMIPLARELSSDRFTPEERAKVRELSERDGVFILANMLYRLCGERSRSMHS